MKGRQYRLRRCRFARNRRLPRTKKGRSRIKASSFKYGHDNIIDFTGEMSRVNERRPHLSNYSCKMSIRPSSLLVVAVLACCFLDPREPQQVIVAAGLHPHPGPKKQLQPEPEQMEKGEDEAKRQRCSAPPLEIIVGPLWHEWCQSYDQEGGGEREKGKGVSQKAENNRESKRKN